MLIVDVVVDAFVAAVLVDAAVDVGVVAVLLVVVVGGAGGTSN